MSEYGEDTWCIDTLSPGRIARDQNVVLQALFRRLITPRGTLRGGDEELAYGLDVAGLVGAVGFPTAADLLPGQVSSEFLKDDRVTSVIVDSTLVTELNGLTDITLDIQVSLLDEEEPFPLTISITDTDVALIGGIAA